jgi:regulator of sigma D
MKSVESTKTKANGGTERRTGSRELVDKLIGERTEMLALFCRLAGLEPYDTPKSRGNAQKLLQEFCQVLVDYIAAGHFSLYERIVNGTERRAEISKLAQDNYSRIAATTELALDFNDKYDCEDHCELTPRFHDDLSMLGEHLASRIELEDRLLAKMLSR